MPDTKLKQMYDLLEGGAVKRYHIKDTMREQPVANHSWRMAAILNSLWPDARRELILATLFHDVSERVSGDIPSHIKWANPGLRSELNRITKEEEERLGIRYNLEVEEQNILTFLDRFEGAMFCMDEVERGNRKMQYTFGVYLRIAADTKLHESVYSKRVDHMKHMVNHLRERAAELGIPLPEDR